MTTINDMPFYVCDFERGCVGRTREAEEAAMLVSCLGDDASVQNAAGMLLWSQGLDGDAGESYDHAAEVMYTRLQAGGAKMTITMVHRG